MSKLFNQLKFILRKLVIYNIHKCKVLYLMKMADPVRADRIIWIDLEMTGLNVERHRIIEVASIITDDHLNIVSEKFQLAIKHSKDVYNRMLPWAEEQHLKTGLTEESKNSIYDEAMAEEALLNFIKRYVPYKTCPIAGNTIYMDKAFLQKYMPKVVDYIGEKMIDVSSINELTKRWNKKIASKKQRKTGNHRALGDIEDSINELNYYRKKIFL